MKQSKWTNKEINIIKTNLNNDKTINDLMELLPDRSYIAIKTKLNKDLKLKIKRIGTKNETFFEIPNTLNSSVAGVISSDGHITSNC